MGPLAPEFELHGRPDIPDSTVYRGREASKEFWRMPQEVWTELRWEPLEFTDRTDAESRERVFQLSEWR